MAVRFLTGSKRLLRVPLGRRAYSTFAPRPSHRECLSQVYAPTRKPQSGPASDFSAESYRLLIRAGLIRPSSTGIYALLPLGWRVIAHLTKILDQAMVHDLGAHKLSLPLLLPAHLWQTTGRWETAGAELFRLQDRKDAQYCLAPTHEEEITKLVAQDVTSYRQLPVRLYQIDRKFRDEMRVRTGVLRAREFIMKDLYTFDADESAARQTYDQVRAAYRALFQRLGIKALEARADSGNIGGSFSHEFHIPSPAGEDTLLRCTTCGYTANQECADTGPAPVPQQVLSDSLLSAIKHVLQQWHQVNGTQQMFDLPQDSNLPYHIVLGAARHVTSSATSNVHLTIAVLQKDRHLDHHRLARALAPEWEAMPLHALPNDSTLSADSCIPQQPLRTRLTQVLVDHHLAFPTNRPANITMPLTNVPHTHPIVWVHAPLSQVQANDSCPHCPTAAMSRLEPLRAIEVGHTFLLGTRYSEPLKALIHPQPSNIAKNRPRGLVPMQMGCYGLGVTRILGAVADTHHDTHGLQWPVALAPYRLCIVPLYPQASLGKPGPTLNAPCSGVGAHHTVPPTHAHWQLAMELYDHLQTRSHAKASYPLPTATHESTLVAAPAPSWFWRGEVVIDDRQGLTPGQRFKDVELIGFPLVIVIGKQYLEHQELEIHVRATRQKIYLTVRSTLEFLDAFVQTHEPDL